MDIQQLEYSIREHANKKNTKAIGAKVLNREDIDNKNKEILKTAKSFEGLFVSMIIKEMRKAIPKSDFLNGGQGEEIFQDMLDNAYAEKMAGSRGFGLADAMYRQMKITIPEAEEKEAAAELF